jgi:hypothetical protein
MTKQTPSSLGEILGKVMGEHGLGRGDMMAKLLSVWDGTVGAGIAKHALPESIKGGKLTVIVIAGLDAPALGDGGQLKDKLGHGRGTVRPQFRSVLGRPTQAR